MKIRNELVTLKSPLSVNYEVTPRCNLFCKFCFNATQSCTTLKHPPFSQVKKILNALKQAEVFEVRLFGGEFFTFPHWKETVEYADNLDFFLSFVSNGTLITPKIVKFLSSHRINSGAISLHGPRKVYEKISGVNGSFDSVLAGIRTCLEANIELCVLYTLTRENKELIFITVKELMEFGLKIDAISVGRLTPYGRAKSDWGKVKLSFADYMAIFPQLERVRHELNVTANFGDAFPFCLLPKKYHEYIIGCWQGTGFGHVDHTGNVRSCTIAKGSYGNILKTPLSKIWIEKLKDFRSLRWLPTKCQACKNFCGGGCSATQYNGGLYSPDEFLTTGAIK